MRRRLNVRLVLAILVIISGVADVVSTLPRVEAETNPLYLSFPNNAFIESYGIWILFAIKFFVLAMIIKVLYKSKVVNKDGYKFLAVSSCLLIIGLQFLAAGSNYFVDKQYDEYERLGLPIPELSYAEKVYHYGDFVITWGMIPLLFAVVSFMIYYRMKEQDENLAIKQTHDGTIVEYDLDVDTYNNL